MAPTHSFTQKTTTVTYPWPSMVTGLERIVLSAQGDLQRILSAYFARPISVVVISTHIFWQPAPGAPLEAFKHPIQTAIAIASPETPIIQKRQVHLKCSKKTICTATSTVRMSSPSSAQLFLIDKYAIGQTFQRLEKVPVFELLSVGVGAYDPDDNLGTDKSTPTSSKDSERDRRLWRRYSLSVPSFDCEIVEVFSDRQMFVHGGTWLDDRFGVGARILGPFHSLKELNLTSHTLWLLNLVNTVILLALGFSLIFACDLVSLMGKD